MTKADLLNNVLKWGVLTAIVLIACPDLSWATVGDTLDTAKTQAGKVAPIIGVVAYTAGAFLGVSGSLKLKAHAEAPANNKLAPAIGQLGTAGALVALPTLLGTMSQSLNLSGSANYSGINALN